MTAAELFVPLGLLECGGGMIRGKVRLQKMAFLAQQRGGTVDYEFVPAPLGPLSYRLTSVMEQLQQMGLAEEDAERTASGNPVYCYRLTGLGRSVLGALRSGAEIPEALQDAVRAVHGEYGGMSYRKLLDFVHEQYPVYHLKGISLEDFGRVR